MRLPRDEHCSPHHEGAGPRARENYPGVDTSGHRYFVRERTCDLRVTSFCAKKEPVAYRDHAFCVQEPMTCRDPVASPAVTGFLYEK